MGVAGILAVLDALKTPRRHIPPLHAGRVDALERAGDDYFNYLIVLNL